MTAQVSPGAAPRLNVVQITVPQTGKTTMPGVRGLTSHITEAKAGHDEGRPPDTGRSTSSRATRQRRQAGLLVTGKHVAISGVSLVAQKEKNPPTIHETQVRSLDQKDPLEKGMATHSSILAWRIPWTEEPGGPQSMGSRKSRT